MSRPPKQPDWVYRCKCGNTVRIPDRIAAASPYFPPACNGGKDHPHKWLAMQKVEAAA